MRESLVSIGSRFSEPAAGRVPRGRYEKPAMTPEGNHPLPQPRALRISRTRASAELAARARVLLPPVALVASSVVTNFTLHAATLI